MARDTGKPQPDDTSNSNRIKDPTSGPPARSR